MRWFDVMLLVTFFGTHAAIGGEAYGTLRTPVRLPGEARARDAVPVSASAMAARRCGASRNRRRLAAGHRPFAQLRRDAAG